MRTNPDYSGLIDKYSMRTREKIYRWRKGRHSFNKIAQFLYPEIDVSGYMLEREIKIFDMMTMERKDLKLDVMSMEIKGAPFPEIIEFLFMNDVIVDETGLSYALEKWYGDDGKEVKPARSPKRRLRDTLYICDPVTDFPLNGGSVSTGRISYRPRF